MSDEKDKHFVRQSGRSLKGGKPPLDKKPSVKEFASVEVTPENTPIKQKFQESQKASQASSRRDQNTPFSFSTNTVLALRKIMQTQSTNILDYLKDKAIRFVTKKQQGRLAKLRGERELFQQSNNQLSLLVLNKFLGLMDDHMKKTQLPQKSVVRINQQKQMDKQLTSINEQIEAKNYVLVKNNVQTLLKKYGKDQYVASKVQQYHYILSLTEQYQRDLQIIKETSALLQKIAAVDTSQEQLSSATQLLKAIKRDITTAVNKQNKKTQKNEDYLQIFAQADKLSSFVNELVEMKKPAPVTPKKMSPQQIKADKQEKDLQKSLEIIKAFLNQKKWKPAKTTIANCLKKYQTNQNPNIIRSLQTLLPINSLVQQIQAQQTKVLEMEKAQGALVKQTQSLREELRALEQYDNLINDIANGHNQDTYNLRKITDEIKKDKKKKLQKRYVGLLKISDYLLAQKSPKTPVKGQKVGQTGSEVDSREKIRNNSSQEEADTIQRLLKACKKTIQNQTELNQNSWIGIFIESKGNRLCDSLLDVLKRVSLKYSKKIKSDQIQIQKVTSRVNDLQRRLSQGRDSISDKSSRMQQLKRSPSDMRSSRKSSRSRGKEDKIKQTMQDYIEEERIMLKRIEELEASKKGLEMEKLEHRKKINQLEGQLQISQGRRTDTQKRYQAELATYKGTSVQQKEEVIASPQIQMSPGSDSKPNSLGLKMNYDTQQLFDIVQDRGDVRARAARAKQLAAEKKRKQAQEKDKPVQQKPVQQKPVQVVQTPQMIIAELRKRIAILQQQKARLSSSQKESQQQQQQYQKQSNKYEGIVQKLRAQISQLQKKIKDQEQKHQRQVQGKVNSALESQKKKIAELQNSLAVSQKQRTDIEKKVQQGLLSNQSAQNEQKQQIIAVYPQVCPSSGEKTNTLGLKMNYDTQQLFDIVQDKNDVRARAARAKQLAAEKKRKEAQEKSKPAQPKPAQVVQTPQMIIADLRKRITTLEQEKTRLASNNKQSQQQQQQYQKQSNKYEGIVQKLKTEVALLQQKIKEQEQRHLREVQGEVNSALQSQQKAFDQHLQSVEEQKKKIAEESKSLNKKISELQKSLATSEKQRKDIEKRLQQEASTKQTSQIEQKQQEVSVSVQAQASPSSGDKTNTLGLKMNYDTQQLFDIVQDKNDVRARAARAKQLAAEKKRKQAQQKQKSPQKVQTPQMIIADLKKKMSILQQKVDSKSKQLNQQQQQAVTVLQQVIAKLKVKVKALQAQISDLQSKLAARPTQAQIKDLENKLAMKPTQEEICNLLKEEQYSHIVQNIFKERQVQWKKSYVQTISTNKIDEEAIIQAWKLKNLPDLLQKQGTQELNFFLQNELPQLIEQEKASWSKSNPSSQVDQQAIISKWKINQLPSLLRKQRQACLKNFKQKQLPSLLQQNNNNNVNIQQIRASILQEQSTKWQQYKTQLQSQHQQEILQTNSKFHEEIQNLTSEHAQILKKLKQLADIRENQWNAKLARVQAQLRETGQSGKQEKIGKSSSIPPVDEEAIINAWKINQLPSLLRKERQTCIRIFKEKELSDLLAQNSSNFNVEDVRAQVRQEQASRWQQQIQRLQGQWQQNMSIQQAKWQQIQNQLQSKSINAIDNVITLKTMQIESQIEAKWQQKNNQWQLKYTMILRQLQSLKGDSKRNDSESTSLYKQWQEKKQAQWKIKIIQIQREIQQNILSQKEQEWRSSQEGVVNDIVNRKIMEVESEFHQRIIPDIIYQQKIFWGGEIDGLNFSIQKGQEEVNNLKRRIQQLHTQLEAKEASLSQALNRNQASQQQLIKVKTQIQTQRSAQETQKFNQQLRKRKSLQNDIEDLQRIIQRQKQQIRNQTNLARQNDQLKQQILNLQQKYRSSQSSRNGQASQKTQLQIIIQRLTGQVNLLNLKLSDTEQKAALDKDQDKVFSLQRQMATLMATIQTKDSEIVFLNITVDKVSDQLKNFRSKMEAENGRKQNLQKSIAEISASKIQLQYQIRYLKDRQEALTRKLQAKQFQMMNLTRKQGQQRDSLSKKMRSHLQMASSLQIRFNQVQSLLSLKTKQLQSSNHEVNRQRFEVDRLTGANRTLHQQKDQIRRQMRDYQAKVQKVYQQKQRYFDQYNKIKINNVHSSQREEELKRQIQSVTWRQKQTEKIKAKYQQQITRLRHNNLRLIASAEQSQRAAKNFEERSIRLEQEVTQLRSRNYQVQPTQIQMLNRINRDVANLTVQNRQLEAKCNMLQSRQVLSSSASLVMNFFLLVQKHTDIYVNFLVQEGVLRQLDDYHRFVEQSQNLLRSNRVQQYFQRWQLVLTQISRQIMSSRDHQIQAQTQQLHALRLQVSQARARQMSDQADQHQLADDYQKVLGNIKELVQEYVKSGDSEYIRILCQQLNLTA